MLDKKTALKKVDKIASPVQTFLLIGVIIGLIGVFASPFIWVWGSWHLAWRISVSSVVTTFVFNQSLGLVNEIVETAKKEISDIIDKP
jgi:hypothetical protein